MKKKVLVFSDEYPPAGGGAGVVAEQLTENLCTMGHVVTLITGNECKNTIDPHARSHIKVIRKTLIWPFTYLAALIKINLESYDLIIVNDLVAAHISGLFFKKKVLSKCILLIHGQDAKHVYENSSFKNSLFLLKAAYSRTLSNCKQVTAVSKYAMDLYHDFLPSHLKNIKLNFHYAGLNIKSIPKPKLTSKNDIGIPIDSILFFSACRLVEEKGLFKQLSIFEELTKRYDNLFWIIAGNGPSKDYLVDKIEALGLSSRIKLIGHKTKPELANYYSLCDIFWQLSHATYETFGLAYLEAAFYGAPSIALKNAGVIESITEGINGYFYESDIEDVIKKCLNLDKKKIKEFSYNFDSKKFAKFLTN